MKLIKNQYELKKSEFQEQHLFSKKLTVMKFIITFISFVFVSSTTLAQGLLFETFNYGTNPGSIVSLSGGKWVEYSTTTTPNNIQYNPAGSLLFPNCNAAGGRLDFVSTGQDIATAFSRSVTSNNVYAAFLVNFSAAQVTTAGGGDWFCHFMLNTTTTTNSLAGRVFVKLNGSNINFGLMKTNGGSTPYSTNGYLLNTTYCLVLKYTFNTATTTDDVATLYVFDATNGIPVTEPLSSELSISANTDATAIGAIAVRQGAATAGATGAFDNIIVDTTWPNMVSLLPIKLKSFNSAYKNNSVILNWQSMYENNFDFYQLEKSTDANQFTTVATIKGKSINGNAADYSFTDASIVKDKQYYRLKMVNRDGSFNYSQVITSSSKSTLEISLYPNPVNNLLIVTHSQLSEIGTLQIFNQEGKLVKSTTTQKGTAQTTVDVESLNKGAYALYFLVNGNSSVLKFVK